jgi:predicted TIM-barrel fold metal-dependent hydrolase
MGLVGCSPDGQKTTGHKNDFPIHDCHVHALSPALLRVWQERGTPFNRRDVYYTNIDSILSVLGAETIDLISVGYFFTSSIMYSGSDGRERLVAENDFILDCAAKHPQRVRPFVAIDPFMAAPTEEIDRCLLANPTIGVKIHANVSRIFLRDQTHIRKLDTVLTHAAQKDIPVLLHFHNMGFDFGRVDFSILVDSILVNLPPIKLRLAHLGAGGGRFSTQNLAVLDTYLEFLKQNRIPQEHQIRFDLSAVFIGENEEEIPPLTNEEIAYLRAYFRKVDPHLLLFGSDYPLYTSTDYRDVLVNTLKMDLALFTQSRQHGTD